MSKMYNANGGLTAAYVDQYCRKGEIDHDIEDAKYALDKTREEFGEQSPEEYYNNIEYEAQAEEVGRLEGQMEFYERYRDGDDPEAFRIAKLLLGINEGK